jgi:hypothetical protein
MRRTSVVFLKFVVSKRNRSHRWNMGSTQDHENTTADPSPAAQDDQDYCQGRSFTSFRMTAACMLRTLETEH